MTDTTPTPSRPGLRARAGSGRAEPRVRWFQGRWTGVALILVLLALWQVSALYWVTSENWPPLTAVAAAAVEGFGSGELVEVFGSSLLRMAIGFAIGAVAAVIVGLHMATIPLVRRALEPLVELLRPIPIPAIVPPLILLLGLDDKLKIFIVAFSVFFPVLVNTVQGVRAIDPVPLAVARTFRLSRARILLRVVLPASLPYIMAGLRISLALALIVTVVAEMIAGSAGIGYYLMTMQYAMRAADMYAAVFVLAAVGYALNRLFLMVERRLLHWYQTGAAKGDRP